MTKKKLSKPIKYANKTTEPVFWSLLAIAVLIPVISSTSLTADPWDIWKITVLKIAVIFGAAAWLIGSITNKRLEFIRSAADLPWLAFLGIGVLATFLSPVPAISFFGQYLRYEGWITWLLYASVFWLTVQVVNDTKRLSMLLDVWMTIASILAVYGILQHFGIDFRAWKSGGPFEVFRSFGTIGNPLGFSAYLVLVFPVVIYRLMRAKNKVGRATFAGLVFLIIAAVIFSFSRASWVGLALSMIVFAPMALSSIASKKRALAITSITLAVALLIAIMSVVPSGIAGRSSLGQAVAITADISNGSSASRLHLWGLTVSQIMKQPLLGYGFDTFKELSGRFLDEQQFHLEPDTLFDRPHSNLLQIAFSTGLIGLAAYIWLMLAALGAWLRSFKTIEDKLLGWSLMCGCIAYIATIQFGFTVVSTAPAFWIAAGLLSSQALRSTHGREFSLNWPLKGKSAQTSKALIVLLAVIMIISGLRPIAADLVYRKAKGYADIEAARSSVGLLDRAIKLNPRVSEYYEDKARTLFYLAESSSESIDHAYALEAVRAFEESARMGVNNLQAYTGIAEIYYRLDEPQQSAAFARKALFEYRYSSVSRKLLARALVKQRRYSEAKQQWRELIELRGNEADGYVGLGLTLYLEGERAEAEKLFAQALKIDPESIEAKQAIDLIKDASGGSAQETSP